MEIKKIYQASKSDNDNRNMAFYRLSLYGCVIKDLTENDELHIVNIKETSEHNDDGKFTLIRLVVIFELIRTIPRTERIDA